MFASTTLTAVREGELFDLAVIGAGPAGCACAIWAATRGLRVLLVERDSVSRFRPGECLHPGIEVPLRDLGVLDDVLELSVVRPPVRTVVSAGRRSVEYFGSDANGQWRAFHISRSDLDGALVRRALQLDVTLLKGCSRVTPTGLNKAGAGVEIDGRVFSCEYLIDASGQGAWLTRALGRTMIATSPRLTAFYGYCLGNIPHDQLFDADANGWQWVAQVSPSVVNWTSLKFGSQKRPKPPATVSSLTPYGRVGGADVTWRIAPSVSGPSHFILGDAAFVTDPAAGNGVLRALMSGIKAAHNARAVLRGQATRTSAACDYQTWLRRWFENDTAKLARLYGTLNRHWCAAHTETVC